MCEACWRQKNPDRPAYRFVGDLDPGVCCFCGGEAGGIYVRADPKLTMCLGKGPEHENSTP